VIPTLHRFESPIEEKMSAILDELRVAYTAQFEVGEQKFGGECRSHRWCEWKDNDNYSSYDPGTGPVCQVEGHPDSEDVCSWFSEIKIYPLYRLDFAIEIKEQKIAIECDGYDYHKRTTEQAQSDIKRDKWLRDNGWIVKRYSGTFIVNHRSKVKREIQEIIDKLTRTGEPKQNLLW